MSLPSSTPDHIILLTLCTIKGLEPARLRALLGTYSPGSITQSSTRELSSVPGIGPTLAGDIHALLHDTRKFLSVTESISRRLEQLDTLGARLITILDDTYPGLLREIYDPPPFLFVRGDVSALSLPGIAVVGTRQATAYGKKATAGICGSLVRNGLTIISGMAYGIDTAAHHAALEHDGKTIAVLARGVDHTYTDPRGRLWPKIVEHGAIVSEEWPGTTVTPEKFPKRNRLISGLSLGTLLVESDISGGSLITASIALEQNRDVFAVPGPIFSRTSRGTNALIERGHAKLVTSADSILSELSPPASTGSVTHTTQRHSAEDIHVSEEEKYILDLLSEAPLHIDQLAEKTGTAPSILLITLFDMEMKNLVEQLPGQLFERV
ncbi:MAG TPA: DNA-protecting protein DprA [Prosthecochloris aestuarii]|uniref:DNA-protecting protein DprA n=1 Tax=Prosthecochloris aestuarii TaxID=1102 RepID=A0A831SU82_PROAE|nr:DNA-protecting protein DprA [Prosthecochloris aestuarii]